MNVDADQVLRASRTLALVGGFLAIVIAPALLVLETGADNLGLSDFTGVAVTLILALVLLVAAFLTKENPLTAVALAFIASLALLVLGGTAGILGGLFGLTAAVLGALPLAQSLVS